MLRIILGVIAGFFAWATAWFGGEAILSAIWPKSYGAHQAAFEAAIVNGGPFTADTTMLLAHIVLGSAVSVLSGFLAALIARGNRRAPLLFGLLLLAFGFLKMAMSWPYVPIWYHVIFTGLLLPITILGGRLKTAAIRGIVRQHSDDRTDSQFSVQYRRRQQRAAPFSSWLSGA